MNENLPEALKSLLAPNIIACVAGSYIDGSEHCLELEKAQDVIKYSETNACVINLPLKISHIPKKYLLLKDLLDSFMNKKAIVPLLNTSRASNKEEATKMVNLGLNSLKEFLEDNFYHPAFVKLEILDNNLIPNNMETLNCLRSFPKELRAGTIPFLEPKVEDVKTAIQLGCPAIRLLAGRIGQQSGIINTGAITNAIIATDNIPVILEGGLRNEQDLSICSKLGATAVLMNSTFKKSNNPGALAKKLRLTANLAWSKQPNYVQS